MNEFEIEDAVMGCQGILDDLRSLSWRLDDNINTIDPRDVSDLVRGIEVLYEIKFKKLWEKLNEK